MFDWIKSLFHKPRFEKEALYVPKVKRIIVSDGKISYQDLINICGSKPKAKYAIEKLRSKGMQISCIVLPLDSGKKHQFCGSTTTYYLED